MLLLLAMAYANVVYDRCGTFGLAGDSCSALRSYDQTNYQNLLQSGGGYPVLRDKNCESGRCMAKFYKDECELCDDEACRKACASKKSNTKELLEFLKEIITAKYKYASTNQFEILNEGQASTKTTTVTTTQSAEAKTVTEAPQPVQTAQPVQPAQTTTAKGCEGPGCNAAPKQQPAVPQVVSVTSSEVRTVTVYNSASPQQISSSPSTAGQSTPPTAAKACNDLFGSSPECVQMINVLEKRINERIKVNIDQLKTSNTASNCHPDENECRKGIQPPVARKKSKRRPAECEGADCFGSELTSAEPERGSEVSSRTSAGHSSAAGSVTTLIRVLSKTVTEDRPITLFREYTTTTTVEKPIINYKITTVTDMATTTITRVERVGNEPGRATTTADGSGRPGKVASAEAGASPQTVTVGPQGSSQLISDPEKRGKLEELVKQVCELGNCAGSQPATTTTAPAQVPSAPKTVTVAPTETTAETKTVTAANRAEAPMVIYRTKTVSATVTMNERDIPRTPLKRAVKRQTTTRDQPDAQATATVTVPVYRTITETVDADSEGEIETVYSTITRRPKRAQKAVSTTNQTDQDAPPKITLRCNMSKTNCNSSSQNGTGVKKLSGARTIINTIYSIQKAGQSGGARDAVTTTVRISI
ncbi:hypothetical protein PAPHI01_2216 [Pancytospora philotis]|nr:hypothetical protein PAPHI01_2216 [Pancytospora philotis]